jgi:dTMP kinase
VAKTLKKGLLITLEGPEGSGKSTQSRSLSRFLRQKGFDTIRVWDPGSTKLGESVRAILLHSKKSISANAETMLYLAARAQLVDEKIIPALKRRSIVICDRFADATLCYQGYGLGVDKDMIRVFNDFVTRSIIPDITFFLDTNIHAGLQRSKSLKGFSDRIEKRGRDFHERVRKGYLEIAVRSPERIKRIYIDASDEKNTREIIRKVVTDAIEGYQGTRQGS